VRLDRDRFVTPPEGYRVLGQTFFPPEGYGVLEQGLHENIFSSHRVLCIWLHMGSGPLSCEGGGGGGGDTLIVSVGLI